MCSQTWWEGSVLKGHMTYSLETEMLISEVKKRGLNIWPMLAIFKIRSKLAPKIPDEVIQAVCKEYLNKIGQLRSDFPYFLEVLKRKSEDYFARKNMRESAEIKKAPVTLRLADLMK